MKLLRKGFHESGPSPRNKLPREIEKSKEKQTVDCQRKKHLQLEIELVFVYTRRILPLPTTTDLQKSENDSRRFLGEEKKNPRQLKSEH